MSEQNYRNHRHIVITYHVLTLLPLLALGIGSVRNLVKAAGGNVYDAALILVITYILASLYYHARVFSLKVQDRAIKAEEGLRYFILTGKRLDQRLSLQQIIALRFASDEELSSLAQRAVEEGLSNNAIKKQIKNWRAETIPRV